MKLHHVGVILKHQRQMEGLIKLLGLKEVSRGWVEKYQAECIMLEGSGMMIECIFSDYGPLASYNNGKGGIHHIALALEPGESCPPEAPLLEKAPVRGIAGLDVNFIHPMLTGFPIEIVARENGDD